MSYHDGQLHAHLSGHEFWDACYERAEQELYESPICAYCDTPELLTDGLSPCPRHPTGTGPHGFIVGREPTEAEVQRRAEELHEEGP